MDSRDENLIRNLDVNPKTKKKNHFGNLPATRRIILNWIIK
jgi:hypothetical protein